MNEIIVDAIVSNINMVTEFIDEQLEAMDCPIKTQMQIDIVIDELFSNIANYSYGDQVGKATISIDKITESNRVKITFIDEGIQYNPLEKEDPDITLGAQDRPIGGLGLFIVKKTMDDVQYEYKDGKNILSVWKQL